MNYSEGAYICSRMANGCGRVRIKTTWLDQAVEDALMFLLLLRESTDTPTVDAAPTDDEGDPVAEVDEEIESAQRAYDVGDLEMTDLIRMLKGLRAKRAKLVEAQRASVEEPVWWTPIETYVEADLSVKRSVLRQHIAAVPVVPTSKPGRNSYDASRFSIHTTHVDPETGKARVINGVETVALTGLRSAMALGRRRKAQDGTVVTVSWDSGVGIGVTWN